jgi:hypothetical protein
VPIYVVGWGGEQEERKLKKERSGRKKSWRDLAEQKKSANTGNCGNREMSNRGWGEKNKGLRSDQKKGDKTRQEQEKESLQEERLPERTEEPRRGNNIAQKNMEHVWSNKVKGQNRWRRN